MPDGKKGHCLVLGIAEVCNDQGGNGGVIARRFPLFFSHVQSLEMSVW